MQKWEYLFIICTQNEKNVWMARYINGQEVPNWFEGSPMEKISNDLGDKGWELLVFANQTGVNRLVFKRPKE